ncbi:hypothetical protein [Chondromyces crocatus]|uniref:Uncharacterized protein n=1 Tax=Chondromyces crocatus TaxID=52 RepID=A0A0K1EM34_CHOCO|nr:hypothetical protein [Chondromyces crocatus]AKT41876.1 uncharacterized protein CMC5_060970 [Chondromyces crocatus]
MVRLALRRLSSIPLGAGRTLAAALLTTLAVGSLLAPSWLLSVGSRRAAACLAEVEAPRGPSLPDCNQQQRWFSVPSHVPWTRQAATYASEELQVRQALASYTDAAVGHPDRASLDHASGALQNAERLVLEGSQRLRFEDFGPPAPLPRLGREASLLGDRRTLLQLSDAWGDWYVRLHALRAALMEADLPRAQTLAARYAEFDPRDEDLRVTVAATLCLGDDARRGMEMLTLTQDDRASRRYAGMSRSWGDVRVLLIACAARAGLEPPPRPTRIDAGDEDLVDVRAVQSWRLAFARNDRAGLHRVAAWAQELLLSSDRPPESRAGLLVTVLTEANDLDPATLVALVQPRTEIHDTRLAPGLQLALPSFRAPGLRRPVVPGQHLVAAAARMATLAMSPELGNDDRQLLLDAAGALAFEAAREFALAGNPTAALDVLDRHERTIDTTALALARSSVWYLAGDPQRALEALASIARPPDLSGTHRIAHAAVTLQRAELLALLGRRDEAGRAAVEADEIIAGGLAPGLEARARWTRLALSRRANTAPLPPGMAPVLPHPSDGAHLFPWPWVGFADPDAPWTRPEQPALRTALERWAATRSAPPPERRALRFAALRRRGDAPPALWAYLILGGELLAEGEGDVETWLDALMALDARRFTFRELALSRAGAARWRGDTEHAATWQRRYETLRALIADPERAEIARFLGF